MESNFRQVAELYDGFIRFKTGSYDRYEQKTLPSLLSLSLLITVLR